MHYAFYELIRYAYENTILLTVPQCLINRTFSFVLFFLSLKRFCSFI